MKKISIITICLNAVDTIEDTIKSVIYQNYPELEYIIIDGGSTDGTLDIISKYKENISYFVSEKDKGISDAFNKGITAATGEIIGIINADDLLYRNALYNVDKAFNENINADVIYGNCITFESDNITGREKTPNTNPDSLRIGFEMCHQSAFVRKDAYLKYGMYDLNYKITMDFELFSKMYIEGANFKYINAPLSCFRRGGVSSNRKKLFQENKKIALRNGSTKKEYYIYELKHKNSRIFLINFLKKIGVYYSIRSLLNPKVEYNVIWWEQL